MTPFWWGLLTGLCFGVPIGMAILGALFLSRPQHREIGRDEIAQLKR